MKRLLQVLRAGPLTTVQDAGRAGHGHLGVPPSGALDRPAFELANRLLGNDPHAALLETTILGPTLLLRSTQAHHIALTGAPAPLWIDGRPADLYAAVAVFPGQRIELGHAVSGMHSYLAIAGGIIGDPTLASLSTDVLTGLGPPALTDGSTVLLGSPGAVPTIDVAPVSAPGSHTRLQVIAGPRQDWITAEAIELMSSGRWNVSPDSNRVGLRLDGPALPWAVDLELPSEGAVTGAVQVPPSGQPIIFLNDHPVTGGYPVVAVLTDAALALAAQLRPGSVVSFWFQRTS